MTQDIGSDFNPEPVVSPPSTSREATTVVAPPEEPADTGFNLEAMEADRTVMVFGTVPTVTDESQISCEVIEDGTQLMVIVKGHVHTVTLPAEVDPGQAQASYTNGLFSVTLKKVEEEPS